MTSEISRSEAFGPYDLAVASDGRVFVSWLEPATPKGHVLRFSMRGPQGWSAPKTIARGTNWFANPADFPSMSVLADGTLAATWLVMSGGDDSEAYDINLAFSKDGGTTWTKPVLPHLDRKKREHGFLSLAPSADGKLAADKQVISTAGGTSPVWRRDGTELFFIAADGQMMAASVNTNGTAFEFAAPKPLFKSRTMSLEGRIYHEYDVSPDGQRFLIGTLIGDSKAPPPTVIMNWTALLKK